MKVFENINHSYYEDKISLQKVIKELLPLRKDRKSTRDYCNDYLKSDMRLKEFKEDRFEAEMNHCLEKNPDLKEFTLKDGEIEPDKAMAFRSVLLEIIEDDKESFGYLYWVLASEVNRRNGVVLYPCVIPEEEIEYNIDFDIDKLKVEMTAENNLINKLDMVHEKLMKSGESTYKGTKKTLFEKYCRNQIQAIKDKVSIFGHQPQQTKDEKAINDNAIRSIPKKLDTDKAKNIFDKAIQAGLMVRTETGRYHWEKSIALLAYMCGRLYCGDRIVKDITSDNMIKKGSDYFPETDLNQLFQTKNLGQSHQQLKDKRPPIGHKCVDDLFQ